MSHIFHGISGCWPVAPHGCPGPSFIQHEDAVCPAHGRNALGYQQDGGSLQFTQGLHDSCLCGIVQSAEAVIQNQDFRFLYQGPGDAEPLPLSPGKGQAALTELCLIALGQFHDEVVGSGVEALHHIFVGIKRGKNHNLYVGGRGVRAQAAYHLEAVDAGHHEVKEDQVRLLRGDCVERLLPVGGGAQLEIESRQHLLYKQEVQRDVVDCEHLKL